MKKLGVGILILVFAVLASIVTQSYINTNTYAANSLLAENQVISVATTDGLPANASLGAVSGDGNTLLFGSTATNLPNSGGASGVYVYNIRANTTTRIDVSASGVVANNPGATSVISENGRYVLFRSPATNLIDGSTLYANGLYIRDLQLGTIGVVENHYWNAAGDNLDYPLGVSNDGRFVQVGSRYINSTANNPYKVVVGDRKTGTFVWKTLDTGSDITGVYFNAGGISCEGSISAYSKGQSSYVTDLRNSTTTGTSIATLLGNSPIISCNGSYILYATTDRTQITPTPSGLSQYMHLVHFNRITGERKYIDSDSSGNFDTNTWTTTTGPMQPTNRFEATIADTGDVVFKYKGNFYLKHISDGSGTLEPVAKTLSGSYINVSSRALLTTNGRYIFYLADPYDLGLSPSPSGTQVIRTKTNL